MKISCGTESGKGYITELIKPKTALEEDYTEYSYEQDERSASHLIDRDGSVEKADIHQLLVGERFVANKRKGDWLLFQ